MTERLSMRAIREILRLRWVQEQPHRAVALSTGRSVGAVYETLCHPSRKIPPSVVV